MQIYFPRLSKINLNGRVKRGEVHLIDVLESYLDPDGTEGRREVLENLPNMAHLLRQIADQIDYEYD